MGEWNFFFSKREFIKRKKVTRETKTERTNKEGEKKNESQPTKLPAHVGSHEVEEGRIRSWCSLIQKRLRARPIQEHI